MAEPEERKGLLSMFGFRKSQDKTESAGATGDETLTNELIDHARAFQAMSVADVMTPRVDIVAIEIGSTLAEVVRICVESEHSRLPIYRETLDDPVGVVHIKDVLKLLAPSEEGAPDWSDQVLPKLRRELLYVPSSMTTADLMLKMQAQRIHMALVIDEFGGTDGLVTLEDLVEAVVGDIEDEYDEEAEEDIRLFDNGTVEVEGRVYLSDLEEKLAVTLAPEDSEEEIDTVAGLVAVLAGRVPERGEIIPDAAGGYDFEVLDADPRRIKRLRLHRRAGGTSADSAPADITPADD